jgi:hypothetical protein
MCLISTDIIWRTKPPATHEREREEGTASQLVIRTANKRPVLDEKGMFTHTKTFAFFLQLFPMDLLPLSTCALDLNFERVLIRTYVGLKKRRRRIEGVFEAGFGTR